MTPASTHLQELKLDTEFIDGRYRHTIAEEPVRYETWTRTEIIGEGAFGTVYKETCAERRNLRAVKQLRKSLVRWNEIAILAQLRSYPEHFVMLSGWFEDGINVYLAMEYLPGDLDALLKEQDLSEDDTKRVTKQILAGLEILHDNDICHRDLKPGNILIAHWIPLSVRIGDFGVSKHFDGNTEGRTTTGTRPFMAPEVWGFGDEDTSVYTTAVDMWSLGCLVYFMLTKELPFPETRNLINFLSGRDPFPPSTAVTRSIPHSAVGFIASMLQPSPASRIPASKAQLHSWLLIKKQHETIWNHILPDAGKQAARPKPKQIARSIKDLVLGDKNEPVPLDSLGPKTQPQVSAKKPAPVDCPPGPEKQPRASASVRRIEANQHLLVSAAASGDCELLIEQLGKGAKPMEDPAGYTPIYAAAKNCHLPVIKLLLENGAHLGVEGSRQVSALHGAAIGGNLAIVQYLVDKGADISLQGETKTKGWTALLLAASNGLVDIVRYLLDRGADISEKMLDTGNGPLHLAAQGNHLEVTLLLLERGADPSVKSTDGYMAFHVAAEFGSIDVLKLLFDKGADVSVRGGTPGWTALNLAARYGRLDNVRYLLDRGADISETMLDTGNRALHLAAQGNHPQVALLLLESGADPSAKSTLGFTAFHFAAQFGSIDVLKLLFDKGADISVRGGTAGWSALHLATNNGHFDNVRYLLDRGADISAKMLDSPSGKDALQLAAQGNHPKVASLLLERGADPSVKSKDMFMAFHMAAQFDSIGVLKLLVDRGADISVRGGSAGWTALHLAAQYGRLETVRYLLDSGADIFAKMLDISGKDALQLAAQGNHPEVASLLLERGADPSAKSKDMFMAFHMAAQFGSIEVLKLLVDRGVDISVRGGTASWTALHLAANDGQLDNVRYLLDRGADISAKMLDNSGKDALHLATVGNHPKVVALLLERGADPSSKSKAGFMAFHMAAQFGSIDVLKLLVDTGTCTDISIRGGTAEWTALQLAASNGHLHNVRYLLDRGADISAKRPKTGRDALLQAADKGYLDIVRLLLEKGASSTSTTKAGETAISLAATNGHTDIVRLLIEWSERDMTIPFTQLDNLKLSEHPTQDPTLARSEDGSTTLWNSTIGSSRV